MKAYKMKDSKQNRIARVLKALASPTRLMIFMMLENGEMTVGQIKRKLEIDISTTSKHLTLMHESGLLDRRRVKNTVYYSQPVVIAFQGIRMIIDNAYAIARRLQEDQRREDLENLR